MSIAGGYKVEKQQGAVSLLMMILISVLIFGYMAMQIRLGAEHAVAQVVYQSADALLGLLDSAMERSVYRYKTTACDSMPETALNLGKGSISVDAAQLLNDTCIVRLSAAIGTSRRSIEVGLNASAATSAWAVGKRASVASRVNGVWQLAATPLGEDLNDIFCHDLGNCWVVGNADSLAWYSAGVWTMKNPSTGENYSSVACVASDNCFVAGNNGSGNFIRHWNGVDWNNINYISAAVYDIQCPTSVCYAVGDGGLLLRYSGAWITESSALSTTFYALACFNANECWAVTDNDKKNFVLAHRNGGATWQTLNLPDNNAKTLRTIACSNNVCWAGGDVGELIRLQAGTWSYYGRISNHAWYGMACRDSDSACLVVGNNGAIGRYDGSNWVSETSATNHALNAVMFFPDSAATGVSVGLWREVY